MNISATDNVDNKENNEDICKLINIIIINIFYVEKVNFTYY